MKKMERLAVVAKNPIIYQAPLYREYAATGGDIEVFYLDSMGVDELVDTEFKIIIKWDIPLLEGYRYHFLKNYSPSRYGGFLARVNFGIFSVISKKRHEAVLITGYETLSCWFALIVAKLKGIPVIWRGEAVLRQSERLPLWKRILKKVVLKYFFRSCDAIMYSCTGNKEYLKYYGVTNSKLFPIPCAVDNSYFRSERDKYINKKGEIRSELGIDLTDFVILFSARFTLRKRPMDLLDAVSKIPHQDITVLFVGDGLERERMEIYAKQNGIKAVFVGFINHGLLAKYYSITDVAVVISDYDPSPKVLNEVMNFELPIIVSDVVGTALDLVVHGENGFIVKVGDVDAISEHIVFLFKERKIAIEMGKKSLKIVSVWNFTEDVLWIGKAIKYATKM